MAVKSTAVTVATTATRLDTIIEGADHNTSSSLVPFNNSSQTVYLGGSDVTTSNGVPVAAGSYGPSFSDIDTSEGVYGVVAGTTADVRVLEQGI